MPSIWHHLSLNALGEEGDQRILIQSFYPFSWAVFGLEGAPATISYITMGSPDSSTPVLERQHPRNEGSSVSPSPVAGSNWRRKTSLPGLM